MKFNDSGPMSEKEKKGLAKGVLAKSQPKEEEPDADDLNPQADIEHINIEPADNGYMVTTRHKAPKSKNGKESPVDYESLHHKTVIAHDHPDAAHIRALIGKGKK